MKRHWFTWALSAVLFLWAVLLIVATGVADSSVADSTAAHSADARATTRPPIHLPQAKTSPHAALQAAPADSTQDFVIPTEIAQAQPTYHPREEVAYADPSNFGPRFATDANGAPADHDFILVLHETVGSARSAINTFLTPHPHDQDQVSYHTLIALDGTVFYIVPPEMRAFGAGNSVFDGPSGPETVVTNPNFPPSVNNFAYHVSLETPTDGRDAGPTHSGYTDLQYQSLAWLMARTDIPDERMTTHKAVDRSNSRQDPRSFNFVRFFDLLHQYPGRA